jgi:glycosyltransferase involved in cell wall biosynthesis
MKVSVIIPVYNAERFVQKAVESALQQQETGEVLLIEDNSPDNSLGICIELEKKYENVKLIRHPNGENKGAGATRNLGIEKSKYDYIAFLDADDYYLPDRFSLSTKILENNKTIDGVYEAIGVHFYDPVAKDKWISGGNELLTTIHREVDPKSLFHKLINGGIGYITLDGLIIKKKLLKTCGMFPENLKLHQDTALILQLAACGNLSPGELKRPVALRGIHADNRITRNPNVLETRAMMWKTLLGWAAQKPLDIKKQALLYCKNIEASYQYSKKKKANSFSKWETAKYFFDELIKKPTFSGFIAAFFLAKKYFRIWLCNLVH